jgi:para-aminobenzoate synthetase component 1
MNIAKAKHLPQLSKASVDQVMAMWPSHQPLVMLHSAQPHEQWARWSMLTSPTSYLAARSPESALNDLQVALAHISSSTQRAVDLANIPFHGGWIGYFSYEFGRVLEPAVCNTTRPTYDQQWPLFELAFCPGALVYDHQHQRWFATGDPDHARILIEQLDDCTDRDDQWSAGPIQPTISSDVHVKAIARTIDYIAAGDIFQANITQQCTASFTGHTRAFARHAMKQSGARYGAYMELPDGRCLVSMSPELFLHVDGESRQVTTRPIKGTRPQHTPIHELRDSAKDAAELHMIVDLMRNDLGRLCNFNTVKVTHPREIESHPTVHHGVSTITGTLRDDVDFTDLLQATFPGGSITGAPKIRAMQIIEELETTPRGPYCGCIGFGSACGTTSLNIAIRTIMLHGQRPHGVHDRISGSLRYGMGGGIVADSVPLAEYRESIDKAAVLRLALTPPKLTTHSVEADCSAALKCSGRSDQRRRADLLG